jgi:hypothetical protein
MNPFSDTSIGRLFSPNGVRARSVAGGDQPVIAPPANDPAPNAAALAGRLAAAKRAFSTRRADLTLARGLSKQIAPQSGDLLLATVTEIGHHARLESTEGRRALLYPGDEIIVAYGARYAPDQFDAIVPGAVEPCDLAAGGGIAATVVRRHTRTRQPTRINPNGVLVDRDGAPLNLRQFALPRLLTRPARRAVIAVVGTSMNAGKTTVATQLVRGLSRSGMRVGACKVTGTGSGGDLWSMLDAGAAHALDFTDAGFSTTAGADIDHVEHAAHDIIAHLESRGVDIIVMEIADGLLQRETAALLSAPSRLAARVDAVVLAAADAMGAVAGVDWIGARCLPLRAVSGLVTASPLAAREAAAQCSVDIIPTFDLAQPECAARVALAPPALISTSDVFA